MSRSQNQERYLQRFQKVIDHIYDHLDEALDLNQLADIACVSPYHWHRIYSGMVGETIAATIKRLRLHHAAGLLINSDQSINQIADQSGYTSLQSFTRAFSETYGLPPAKYRSNGSHQIFKVQAENRNDTMMDVTLKNIDAIDVLAIPHTGSYMSIGNAFEKLFGWLGMKGLINSEMKSYGIYFSDPDSIPEAELQSAACAQVTAGSDLELSYGIERKTIAAGEYAVLRHKGPYADMRSAYQWLYGTWLPASGREVADQPCFEDYLNNPREVAPADLLTDIYLPLKPAS
jgi:AraC family transcriptional regulator